MEILRDFLVEHNDDVNITNKDYDNIEMLVNKPFKTPEATTIAEKLQPPENTKSDSKSSSADANIEAHEFDGID